MFQEGPVLVVHSTRSDNSIQIVTWGWKLCLTYLPSSLCVWRLHGPASLQRWGVCLQRWHMHLQVLTLRWLRKLPWWLRWTQLWWYVGRGGLQVFVGYQSSCHCWSTLFPAGVHSFLQEITDSYRLLIKAGIHLFRQEFMVLSSCPLAGVHRLLQEFT